jgi:MFS family permease
MKSIFKSYFKGDASVVLKLPNFRKFLAFRFFMTMATLMQSVIVGWHLYSLTGSILALGMIGLVEVIPQISIALFAGHYVDILNKRKIIMNTTILLIVGSVILFLYSLPVMNAFATFGTFPIYITFFITGVARGILMPAHTAMLGQLVPRVHLANAATWNSANWHVAAVAGPAIGGMMYGFFGISTAYLIISFTYLSSYLIIWRMDIPIEETIRKDTNMIANIREGVSFVFRNQVLLGAFSLDMFSVFFGGAVALLPAFASDILHVGPEGLGFLRACPAIGAIFMAFFLASRPPLKHTGTVLYIGIIGFGLSMIGFALSKVLWLSASFLILSGVCDNISVIIRQTILQLFTPEKMKGRVASVNSIFVGSSNELGGFESGVTARFMGLVPSVIFGGVMTLVTVWIIGWKMPYLRKLSLQEKLRAENL